MNVDITCAFIGRSDNFLITQKSTEKNQHNTVFLSRIIACVVNTVKLMEREREKTTKGKWRKCPKNKAKLKNAHIVYFFAFVWSTVMFIQTLPKSIEPNEYFFYVKEREVPWRKNKRKKSRKENNGNMISLLLYLRCLKITT